MCEVQHFPIHVAIDSMNEQAKVLVRKLRGWKPEEIDIQLLSGGYVNNILKCSNKKKTEEPVVLRIWATTDIPSVDHITELKCVRILSTIGCFPTLFSTFDNGYCYQFYKGEHFNYEPIDNRLVSAFTKGLALFHATEIPDLDRRPWLHELCDQVYKANENEWNNSKLKYGLDFPSKHEFMKILTPVTDMLVKLESPVVLCHGDSHFNNCLWNFKDDHVMFVDCELTKYNYQAFDIAYHFYSYRYDQIFGKDITPEDEDDYQRNWIKQYLKAWYELRGKTDDPTELDCYRVHVQVKKFTLVICLWLTFAILLMKEDKLKDLDLPRIGVRAYSFFLEHHDEYVNLTLPDDDHHIDRSQ